MGSNSDSRRIIRNCHDYVISSFVSTNVPELLRRTASGFLIKLYIKQIYNIFLKVSIGKMMLDISKFVLIFALLIFAWTAGLCHLYQPYSGMVQTDPVSGEKTTQVDSFVDFPMTLKTFFWAIFGMTSIEAADVIIENPEGTASTPINQHVFTQGVGYFCFAGWDFLNF